MRVWTQKVPRRSRMHCACRPGAWNRCRPRRSPICAGTDSDALVDTGTEVVHEDIGSAHEPVQQGESVRVFEIDRDRPPFL